MLEACPGAYLWLGSDGVEPSKPLHNAYYDFNDELIKPGVELWTSLVEAVTEVLRTVMHHQIL
jgi:hippurate hydrolase